MATERIVTIPVNIAIAIPADLDAQDTVAYVADAINETLREHQRSFTPHSCILDYVVCIDQIKNNAADPAGYEEGAAF